MMPFPLRNETFTTLVCAFWIFGLLLWVVYGLFPDPTFLEVQRHARSTQTQLDALRKEISLLHDALTYEAVRGDPLGYGPLPARMTLAQAHELTVASHYPDGLVQLAQLFRTRRCGDLVVTAAPGWDLRARFERPPHRGSHGALHREHMRTPLWSNRRLPRGALRTVDVFAAVLQRLGLPVPAGLDGVPFTIS